ncbi:MAG TPA: fructosamine kinase family protein [Chitinophagaceae bacterium]|nr:fructosamine kinase family protein [Chitinophagaceae bacterium]
MIQDLVKTIANCCGINITRYEQVHGGDINECYCLHGQGINYFLKLNDADRLPAMFEMEAAGLAALRNHSTMIVPELIQHGIVNDKQWLLLQWIEKGSAKKDAMENFGTALANMHKQAQPYFGWHNDNYIGSLLQINTQQHSWTEFYTQCRIMPLVKLLFDKGLFSKPGREDATTFCKKAAGLFPEEPAALLHGDLWGGNYMIHTGGDAVIFDPAVYFGHREMDLGMTKLSGGFSQPFYDAYHEAYPLEKGWQQRIPLTQLYPLLVHAVLFGGHYVINAKEITRRFC